MKLDATTCKKESKVQFFNPSFIHPSTIVFSADKHTHHNKQTADFPNEIPAARIIELIDYFIFE